MIEIIIANILNLVSGICSIISTQGKEKKQIVFIEFIGSVLRVIQAALVKSWSDLIAKVIKIITQFLTLEGKLTKRVFVIISVLYTVLCTYIAYISKDVRCFVAIIPSLMEFYALLEASTKKYRSYIIITKTLWIINNIIFQLYVGIVFDLIVIIGHLFKIKKTKIEV